MSFFVLLVMLNIRDVPILLQVIKVNLPMTVHSNVWGPSRIPTMTEYRWFLTYIHCYSRVAWVYLLHNKTDVLTSLNSKHKMVQSQFEMKMKIFRSDNGKKYFDKNFQRYLDESGIVGQTPSVKTLKERNNREKEHTVIRGG